MVNEYSSNINCPRCGHERNPSTAKKCEICGQPLGKQTSILPLILIGGFLLLAGLGGAYFLFKGKPQSQTIPASTTSSPTTATSTPSGNPPPLDKNQLITAANPELYSSLTQIPNVPAGTFNYGGSTTFAPLRSDQIGQKIKQAHPGFILRYTEPIGKKPGSGTGIAMLIEGQMSFSQSSRPVKDSELEQAVQRGFKLEQVAVAIDGLAFYVNSQLQIPGLTVAQIRDIYTGKITNWQAVGGPDLKITPLSRDPKAGGTVDFFSEGVLEKQPFGAEVKIIRDTTQSIREVSKTPGGIGYATAPEVIGQQTIRPLPLSKSTNQPFIPPHVPGDLNRVNEPAIADGSYPITRRLFVIIKRDGRLDEQAGVAYTNMLLSNEGQTLVKSAGFAPVR
jgi:phosphate transport system substrate-binding protein